MPAFGPDHVHDTTLSGFHIHILMLELDHVRSPLGDSGSFAHRPQPESSPATHGRRESAFLSPTGRLRALGGWFQRSGGLDLALLVNGEP